MEDKILDIMKRAFHSEAVYVTSSQKNCEAWDSLHHLDLILELENEFGISLEPEEIAAMTDFVSILTILKTKL